MAKLEKEIKVLDIDIKETEKRLKKIQAEFKGIKKQNIYTYDFPYISVRFEEAMLLLKSKNDITLKIAKRKLETVIDEFLDLVSDDIIKAIEKEMNTSFKELFQLDSKEIYMTIQKSNLLKKEIKKKQVNPNKWIRLRKSNDKVELTIKHVYEKNSEKIQKVKEFEINVSDLNETNAILEEMGFVRRNYQEKIRHSYHYKDADIEIDEWPMLNPYMEIECDNEKTIEEIIEKLDYKEKEIVSLNTQQLYEKKNIDILKIYDLKF